MHTAKMIKEETEETTIASEPIPRPMEGLHEIAAPPFLTKTYEMVDDTATDEIVSWSRARNSFIVWDSNKFSVTLLPRYFKHGNFSSFIRQLNTYGFRKIDPDRWEFANEGFLGGQKHLLKTIKRRRHGAHNALHQGGASACVEVGQYGLEGVVERLKRDCSVLTTEIVRLKQQHQESREYIVALQNRLRAAERKQQLIMSFMAKALNNPVFIQQFMVETAERKALNGANVKRKRTLTASASTSDVNFQEQIDSLGVLHHSAGQDQIQSHDELVTMGSEFDTLFRAGLESDSLNVVNVQMPESVAQIEESNLDSVNEKLWDELLAGNLVIDNDDDADDDEQLLGDIQEYEDLEGQNPSDWDEEDLQDLVDQLDYHKSKP